MSLDAMCGQVVTVVHRSRVPQGDNYGEDLLQETGREDVGVVLTPPRITPTKSEWSDGATFVTRWHLAAPANLNLGMDDQVLVDGETLVLDGPPLVLRQPPFFSQPHHVEVLLLALAPQ